MIIGRIPERDGISSPFSDVPQMEFATARSSFLKEADWTKGVLDMLGADAEPGVVGGHSPSQSNLSGVAEDIHARLDYLSNAILSVDDRLDRLSADVTSTYQKLSCSVADLNDLNARQRKSSAHEAPKVLLDEVCRRCEALERAAENHKTDLLKLDTALKRCEALERAAEDRSESTSKSAFDPSSERIELALDKMKHIETIEAGMSKQHKVVVDSQANLRSCFSELTKQVGSQEAVIKSLQHIGDLNAVQESQANFRACLSELTKQVASQEALIKGLQNDSTLVLTDQKIMKEVGELVANKIKAEMQLHNYGRGVEDGQVGYMPRTSILAPKPGPSRASSPPRALGMSLTVPRVVSPGIRARTPSPPRLGGECLAQSYSLSSLSNRGSLTVPAGSSPRPWSFSVCSDGSAGSLVAPAPVSLGMQPSAPGPARLAGELAQLSAMGSVGCRPQSPPSRDSSIGSRSSSVSSQLGREGKRTQSARLSLTSSGSHPPKTQYYSAAPPPVARSRPLHSGSRGNKNATS